MSYKDKEWLKKKYKTNSLQDIADIENVSVATIYRWMKKHGIETRGRKEHINSEKKDYQKEGWLKQKYHEEGLTMQEMANLKDIRYNTILRWMKKNEIERRDVGYQQKEGRYKNKEWLQEQYVKERRTTRDIAESCDVTRVTINHWIHKFDIEMRHGSDAHKAGWEGAEERKKQASEHMKTVETPHIQRGHHTEETLQKMSEVKMGKNNPMFGVIGKDNPSWKEDKPQNRFYNLKKWKQTRQKALERDEYQCTKCASEENLVVHHIEPLPDGAKYDLDNLTTLCKTCHGSVHPV